MSYDSESDLKYIDSLGDIPVSGQGIGETWSPQDKLDAAESGESKLEADVNDGNPINGAEHIHGDAAATWATYRLALGVKAPDSTTRGDALDEGSERMDFALELKEDYYEYVDSITAAQGDAGDEDSTTTVDFYVAYW